MKVKVHITDKQKKLKLPTGARLLIRKACTATLIEEDFPDSAEINVTIVDDNEIHKINKQFRDIDNSTDVLSFPLGADGVYDINPENGFLMLGDVVISIEHAISQGELYGHGFEREVAYLTIHSVLHLLGYDHVNGGMEKTIMREKEEKVLDSLGLSVNKA